MKSRWLSLALLLAPGLLCAEATFTARADRSDMSMDDTLRLELAVSGEGIDVERPALPPIPGFRSFPAGQSQNFSFINGRSFSEVVFTYVLQPEAPGNYTIPPVTLRVSGKELSTDPLPVTVRSGAAVPPQATAPPQGLPARGAAGRDLFITTSVDEKNPVVGQQVTLTFRFYSRIPLLGQPRYVAPDVTGFISEDMPPQKSFQQTVDGRSYSVVELKTALFPASAGRLTIGPATLECSVRDASADPFNGSFFGSFFSAGKPLSLRSEPIPVNVSPLPPEGRPSDFKGDVGRYTLSAALDKSSAGLHDPVTLTVRIEGEGNIKALSSPTLPAWAGLKVYETLNELQVRAEGETVRGTKTFRTVLKPEVSGALALAPIAFSYFDPFARRYKTLRSSPLSLNVAPGSAGDSAPSLGTSFAGEGVKVIGKDIRFIKTRGQPVPRRKPFHSTGYFLLLNLLPPVFFLLYWGVRLRREIRFSGAADRSLRRALRDARADLSKAESRLKAGDFAGYYAAIQRVFHAYLGRKMGLPPQGLTWDPVNEALLLSGVSPLLRAEARALWEDFDRARFTPSLMNAGDAALHGDRLKTLLSGLEAGWK